MIPRRALRDLYLADAGAHLRGVGQDDAEKLIRRHLNTWWLDDAIAKRVLPAFRMVGLKVAGQD
ncbi:hypothetical protein KUL25_12675 [Rhodobacteraceae bacterium N5(2021)]|uniref:Uncharacterized protein n=1 Tax=Gymnodinialimonas phycosphaerae TaxID=2841589 RepID=A0A975TRH3_9RHOB|nr:hypothetical protein [Gymnodinialimonas phycosphaerae]MBY4893617.1 hypothetical protein [Gymnodinialimonas phycosphaerae]